MKLWAGDNVSKNTHIFKNYSSWKANQSGAFKLWRWKSLNHKLKSGLEFWEILPVPSPCFYTPLGSQLTTGERVLARWAFSLTRGIHSLPFGFISMYVTKKAVISIKSGMYEVGIAIWIISSFLIIFPFYPELRRIPKTQQGFHTLDSVHG